MDRELAKFFALKFQVDVNNGDISKIRFPTFEEVLGLTDLAILRKESFRNFDIENRATNSGRLRLIAQYLVFLVAKVLDDKLRGHAGFHRQLVSDVGSRIPTEIGLTLLRISQEALHKVLKLISIP